MSEVQKQPQSSGRSETVRVRVRARLLVERQKTADGNIAAEAYAEPGEIIELPRKDAERLAGREFEGYQVVRDAKWKIEGGKVIDSGGSIVAPMPSPIVRDPIVEFV